MPRLFLNQLHQHQTPLISHTPLAVTTRCSITTTTKRLTPSIHRSIPVVALSTSQQIGTVSTTSSSCRSMVTRCMANPRRVKMVAKQIQRELSDMLLTDKVLQFAVLPEAALGADRYLSSLTTISDVEVSTDLQVVKVYVSVFGDERGKEVAISGLKSKAKYVRSELGRRMKLRLTPEVRFIEDESLERGSRVIAILDRLKNEDGKTVSENRADDQRESTDQTDDEDWEENDPDDEGIIYVK